MVKNASVISHAALPQLQATVLTAPVKLAPMAGRPAHARSSYPNRIRAVRESLGLPLETVAKKCGFTATALQRFETGGRELKVRQLELIAKAMKVPPQRLLNSVELVADAHAQAMLEIFEKLPPGERDRLIRMARALIPEPSLNADEAATRKMAS